MLPGVTPDIISAAASPAVYGAVGLILLALGTLAAYKPFVYGLTALFKLKANRFSLTSLAALGCLVQNVVLVISPPQELYSGNTHVYSAIALCGLAFACFSYQTVVENAVVSFKPAFSRYDKYGAVIMKEEYSSAYTKGLIYDAPVLAFCKKAGKINNFAGRAFSSDMTDSVSAKLAPFVGAAAVILGAAVGYSMKSVSVGFTVFAAIAVVSAPFTYTLGSALVMKKTVNRLVRLGATIVGSGGADYYSCLNSITIPAKALFPEDSILLRGIKTFGSTRIDEAIVSAASVACAGESILTDLFMQIVSGKKDMLRPAEGLCYEDGCGLSAWVNKKRVLIGTRELMLSHGVDAPSKDYEEKYTDENNDLIYLSVGGELSAVFIIGLVADAAVAHALRMLEYRDISIVIDTSDPVVTAGRVSALFGVDEEVLKILPSRLKDELARAGEYTDEVYSGVISNGTVCSFAAAVCEAKKLRSSFMLLTVIHLASMLAGLAMIAVFAFMRDFTQLTTSMLLIYQCMWSAFSIIAAKVK